MCQLCDERHNSSTINLHGQTYVPKRDRNYTPPPSSFPKPFIPTTDEAPFELLEYADKTVDPNGRQIRCKKCGAIKPISVLVLDNPAIDVLAEFPHAPMCVLAPKKFQPATLDEYIAERERQIDDLERRVQHLETKIRSWVTGL
jgi:hypothetical protein